MADDYASHYPILAATVARSAEPVMELGCGEGSTPMLHYMCKMGGRLLMTFDSDMQWVNKYTGYKHPQHIIRHVSDWSRIRDFIPGAPRLGVVFVDCAPGDARIKLIAQFRDEARFIVAHDSERDWGTGANYEYEKVKPLFRYVSEFRRWRPYTLVLSNMQPFDIDDCDQVWQPSPELREFYQKQGVTQ